MATCKYVPVDPPPNPEEYVLKLTKDEVVMLLHAMCAYAHPVRGARSCQYGYEKEYNSVDQALRNAC